MELPFACQVIEYPVTMLINFLCIAAVTAVAGCGALAQVAAAVRMWRANWPATVVASQAGWALLLLAASARACQLLWRVAT